MKSLLKNCNPFEKQSECSESEISQQGQFPICLQFTDKNHQHTPMSRFSEASQSQPKSACVESKQLKLDSNVNTKLGYHEEENCDDSKCYVQILERRNEQMAVALQKEKVKNGHIQSILNMIRAEDHRAFRRLEEEQNRNLILSQELQIERNNYDNMERKWEEAKAEIAYLKQLILLANSNYETLQKKYADSLQKNKRIEEHRVLKQKEVNTNMNEMKLILTGLMNNSVGIKTLAKQQKQRKAQNYGSLKSNQKETDEALRKMFIKTLKTKK